MPLTILTDANVKDLVNGLTDNEVEEVQKALRQALHDYSTGTQETNGCAINQPMRTSMQSQEGLTTLFMPATSSAGIGIKVVTLASPDSAEKTQVVRDTTPHGSLQIMSPQGEIEGFLNAEELTVFRTALASTLLLRRRANVKTITVFGAGKQAYWHIRLALLLRGSTIKHVHIINRTFSDRAKALLLSFHMLFPAEQREREGWANTKFSMLTPGYNEYDRMIKEQVRGADVIYCTVPSTAPLFDHTILTSHEGRRKGRLIVGIGSYKPHMIEIPTELILQAARLGPHHHHHKHATEGGVIVVDSLTACLKEAGEIVQAGLSPQYLVEIGELVMLEEADLDNQTQADESNGSSTEDSQPQSPTSDAPRTPPIPSSPTSTHPRISLPFHHSRPSISTVFREDSTSSTTSNSSDLLSPSSPTTPTASHGSHHRSSSHHRNPMARASSFLHHRRSSSMGSNSGGPIGPNSTGSGSANSSQVTLTGSGSSTNLSKGHSRRPSEGRKSEREKKAQAKEDAMSAWLCHGNVVYKSVGMGLMDLAVGAEIIKLARKKNVGTTVREF